MKTKTLLSEKDVKDILKIDDFRHMTKEGAIEFVSLMPQMEPEVALKALEQFPDLVKAALSWANDYKETMIRALDANAEESKMIIESLQTTLDRLNKQLEREDLTSNDYKLLIDSICTIQNRMIELHKTDQKYNINVLQMGLRALTVLGTIVLIGLGASGRIKMPTLKR